MIRLATVGTSWITESFLSAATLSGRFEHCAVYSRSADTAAAFADRVGCHGKIYTDLEKLADDPAIDAVYVASPNALHYAQSKLFLQHKKHVICEKPITLTADEYRELKALADANGCVYMEAIMSRHSPCRDDLLQHVQTLGKTVVARFDFCQRSSRYDAYRQGTLPNVFNVSLGGGSLMDLGVYCVWAAVDLFGMPRNVTASSVLDENGTDLSGCAIFEYDGFCAVLTYSKIGESVIRSEIVGDNATLSINSISTYADSTVIHESKTPLFTTDRTHVMCGEATAFADYIQHPKPFADAYAAVSSQAETVRVCIDEIAKQSHIRYPHN